MLVRVSSGLVVVQIDMLGDIRTAKVGGYVAEAGLEDALDESQFFQLPPDAELRSANPDRSLMLPLLFSNNTSLEEYEVPPSPAVTLNGNGKPEIASNGRNVHNGVHAEGQ